MKIGTYYYPEQWPREQWERDFDNIAAMGLQVVHMAEFAWRSIEPREGEYRLEWLDECVGMAAGRRLDVILCTPTAVPPMWMCAKYPEILLEDKHGTAMRVGGRRHYSPTSPVYLEKARQIAGVLAGRYGKHGSVIGWQIDNEYGAAFGQNGHTHEAFRGWLRRKYETLENLNRAWGTQFWNTQYDDWGQVMFPAGRSLEYDNPHHRLDASRFWSWAFANFNRVQAEAIKGGIAGSPRSPWVTTNFMPFHPDCDPMDMNGDLTLMSWDAYPVSGHGSGMKDETYRLADPAFMGLIHDQMASYNGRWGQMELQPGQVNWSGVPVLLYPGAVRLWIWTALAHGAEFVTTYRFRQARFGTELFHHGLVLPDGVTPSVGGREFQQAIDEVARLDPAKLAQPAPVAPAGSAGKAGAAAGAPPAEVGLLFDFEQMWYFETLPQAKRWNQPRWLVYWYGALARLGLRVRVLHANRPIPKDLPLVVAPGVQMVDEGLVREFEGYAQQGGNLVLTCRTGTMDRTGQLFEGPMAAPIVKLIGGTIEAYDGLPDSTYGSLEMDGQKYPWGVWGELLYNEPETKVLARYADQFYAGAPAVLHHKVGGGSVTYCGVFAEQPFVNALVERLAGQFKLGARVLPERVHLIRRGAYNILLNYQDKPVTAPAPKGTRFLVGAAKVDPAGVAVWEG